VPPGPATVALGLVGALAAGHVDAAVQGPLVDWHLGDAASGADAALGAPDRERAMVIVPFDAASALRSEAPAAGAAASAW